MHKKPAIREITDKKIWEAFLTKPEFSYYPYFQSWNWGEVQKKLGVRLWRLGIDIGDSLSGVFQITDVSARRGHYLHVRHGPLLLPFSEELFDQFLFYIVGLAKEHSCFFIRISPFLKKDTIPSSFFKRRGFNMAPIHNMDAEICWTLDITKSEEQLLLGMRKSHRYLVRKALAMGITITHTKDVSQLDQFIPLYRELHERKRFTPHRGLFEEFETFAQDDSMLLYLATFEKKIISGALIAFVGDMAIYRHGATLFEYRTIPASYVIQWEAIKEAKKRGKKLYNFWGVSPTLSQKHPWYGLTLFKMGFGGQKEEFVHAQDKPLSPLYAKTFLIEYLTKIRKGY